jgi:hypothetical protein
VWAAVPKGAAAFVLCAARSDHRQFSAVNAFSPFDQNLADSEQTEAVGF